MPAKKPSDHDEYLASAPEFARPILEKIRKAMHKGCPGMKESIKWSAPFFDHEGIVAGVNAFKTHLNLTFWQGMNMGDPEGLLERVGKTEMGLLRIEKASDLPTQKVLVAYVAEAAKLNEERSARPKSAKSAPKKLARKNGPGLAAPRDLLAALKRKKQALITFEGFSPTNKKDYIEWITEAKRDATREKRVEQAVAWMAEGKPRNWKYMPAWQGK